MKLLRLFAVGVCCILAGLTLMRNGDNTARKKRELLTGHDINHNIWYRNANLTANKSNMTNCYVCSFVPHHANSNPFWTPEPETEVNTMCLIKFRQDGMFGYNTFAQDLPNCTKSQPLKEWRDPRNYTKSTNQTNLEGIAPARYPTKPPFCFFSPCNKNHREKGDEVIPGLTYLGKSDCKETLQVATIVDMLDRNDGYWHPLYYGSSPSRICNRTYCVMYPAQINWTAVGSRAKIQGWKSTPVMWTFLPSHHGYPSPTTHVWVCGKNMYLYLPEDWCGTCHLARLIPAVVVVPAADVTRAMVNTPKRVKRSTEKTTIDKDREPLIGDVRGVFMTIFPMYGVAYLAHRINEMHTSLEDITESLEGVLKHLVEDPEKRAMRAMILQHRLALDYLLASQGGVCELIGDQCCTFIPDPTSNLTAMLNRVTELRKHLTDGKDGQWSPWTWASSGGYLQVLGKILIPVGAVLILFCVFMTCVLPCLRAMINKAVGQSVTAVMMSEEYITLLHSPDGDGDVDPVDENTEL